MDTTITFELFLRSLGTANTNYKVEDKRMPYFFLSVGAHGYEKKTCHLHNKC